MRSFWWPKYDQVLRSNDSGTASWLLIYHLQQISKIPCTVLNRRMSSCTKLVTNREPSWYLMPFSCTHEALNTSSSSKHPSPDTYSILSQTKWSDMETDVVPPGPQKIIDNMKKSMSSELLPVVPGIECSECVGGFCILFIFWPNPWNTDTWLQIAQLLRCCTRSG